MTIDYDKEIKKLEQAKRAEIEHVLAERRRQSRRAFWLGQAVPVLCFLCLVLTGLMIFGR